MNAFMKFSNHHRADVRAENPDLPMTEVAKLLGKMWRELSTDEKLEWKEGKKKKKGCGCAN